MSIEDLSRELVSCRAGCKGIWNSPEEGRIPRCLYLEKRPGGKKVTVVGINPGNADEKEKKFFRTVFAERKLTSEDVQKYWEENVKDNCPYYKKTRKLVESLGFDGDILWTEIVKCESASEKTIPKQTIRICIHKFLKRELEDTHKNEVIIALGNDAFEYCMVLFPDNFVIGVPHPTPRRGNPMGDLTKKIMVDPKYKEEIAKTTDEHGNIRVIKLAEIK